MDDSMDAFVSTLHRTRPVSLSRKRKVNAKANIKKAAAETNKNISEESPKSIENDALAEKHVVLPLPVGSNDTLFGLEELDHDDSLRVHCENQSNQDICKTDEDAVNPSGKSQEERHCLNNEDLSDGFMCSLCETFVLKKDCGLHHVKCLNEKFASKTGHASRNDVIVCQTCGKEIKTNQHPKHFEECQNANLEVARRISQERVTSSYFSHSRRLNCDCPTCGKDISHLNTPSRHRHVNVCLDKQLSSTDHETRDLSPHPAPSGLTAKSCDQCNKTFKSSRGLKTHLRSCKSKPSVAVQPRRKRKVRSPKNADEDILQLALGISASTSTAAKQKIKEEKRRKKEIPIPAMLQISMTSRKKALEARVKSIISASGSASNSEVSSTPMLPASSKQKDIGLSCPRSEAQKEEDGEISRPALVPSREDNLFSTNERKENFFSDKECSSEERSPMKLSRFASASKWTLTTDAPPDYNFRVAGLLSQFDNISSLPSPPGRAEDQPVSNATSADDKFADVTSADVPQHSSEAIPSTLLDLVNLHNPVDGPGDHESPPARPHLEEAVDEDPTSQADSTMHYSETYQEPMRVLEDLRKMIDDPQLSDLRVETEGKLFYFHKFMLAARCPSLLQVLTEGCDEDGIYHASSCNIQDIHHLQLYIYTGHCGSHEIARDAALKLGSSLPLHRAALTEDKQKNEENNLDIKERVDGSEEDTCGEIDLVMNNSLSSTTFPSDDDLFASFTTPSSLKSKSRPLLSSVRGASANISGNLDGSAFEFPNINIEASSTSKDPSSQDEDATYDDLKAVASSSGKDTNMHFVENKCTSSVSAPVPPNSTSATSQDSVSFGLEEDEVTDAKSKSETPQSLSVEKKLSREDASDLTSHPDVPPPDALPGTHNVFDEEFFFGSNNVDQSQDNDSDLEVYDVSMMECDIDVDVTSRKSLSQPQERIGGPHDEDDAKRGQSQPAPSTDCRPATKEVELTPTDEPDYSVNDSVLLRGVASGLIETPSSKTPTNRRTKSDLVPITPMPNFSDMDTPAIIQKGRRIGLKKTLGKKKMKIKLKEHHAYTHQVESDGEHHAYTHQVESDGEPSTTPPAPKEKKPQSVFGILRLLDDDDDGSESDEPERPRDGLDVIRIYSDENGSDVEELQKTLFGDHLEDPPDKKPSKKIKATDPCEVDQLMHDVITGHGDVYMDILQYRPVFLSRIKKMVEDGDFTVRSNDLLDYLDRQGITFTTSDERKGKIFRRAKRRTKK